MEIGISTLPFFEGKTLEEAVIECKNCGFKNIEIMCESPQANPDDVSRKRREGLALYARKEGLKYFIHAPLADINLMSSNRGVRGEAARQLKETVRFAKDVGARRVVFHIGGKPYMGLYNFEKGYKDAVDALEDVILEGEKSEISLFLENDPNKFGLGAITIENCKKILDAYKGRLFFLLDAAHAHMLGEDAVTKFITEFRHVLRAVHLSDNHGERDEHLGLGQGTLDTEEVVDALKGIGFSGEVILEVKNKEDIESSLNLLRGFS